MRNFLIVMWMFMLLIASSLDCAASEAGGTAVGVEALVDLLQKKGVLSAEELGSVRKQAAGGLASQAGLKALGDLLKSKGIISDEEATAIAESRVTGPSGEEVAPVAGEQEIRSPKIASAEQLDEDLWRANLHLIYWKQGIIGNDEEEQIAERIGKKWSPGEDDDVIAPPDSEIEFHRTTLPKEGLFADIDQLHLVGLVTKDEAERLKERFTRKLALERVTEDMGTELRKALDKQVAEKIIPVPEWTKRIKFSGDFRLRYQGDFFDSGDAETGNGIFVNPANPTQLLNSQIDRHQLRIRGRVAFTAKVNDEVEAGIGLATGNTTSPVSTNATLGDSLNKKNFLLDLAYMKWTPAKNLTLWGGRFASPWFGSDLVWDQDINFDGVAFSYKPQLTPALGLFLTGGAFPIQEIDLSSRDKWLYAGQLGLRYRDENRLTATIAAAIYDFENITGVANDPARPGANDFTAPLFQQKGNTLFDIDPSASIKTAYAAEFRELHFAGALDMGFWDPLRVVLTADYVNNLGFVRADVNLATGLDVKKETEGYQFGIAVGYPETRDLGQWKLLANYKSLESDAVVDAFTDSDFHLGGTNAKGWIAGGDLGVGKNVWLSTRWLSANEISGPLLAVDVFQFSVNARF